MPNEGGVRLKQDVRPVTPKPPARLVLGDARAKCHRTEWCPSHSELADGCLEIRDTVKGLYQHRVEGRWLFEPRWKLSREQGAWFVEDGEHWLRIEIESKHSMSQESTSAQYHPEFGREDVAPCIVWRVEGKLPIEVATRFIPL